MSLIINLKTILNLRTSPAKMAMGALFSWGIFLIPPQAKAANLGVPPTFDSARVLPAGIRKMSYNYIMGAANSKFNSAGAVVGMGNKMHSNISFQQLIESQETELDKGVLEGFLSALGKNPSTSAGRSTGEVNVELDVQLPILALGVTPYWTSAIVVPVVTAKTHVDTGFVASSDFQDLSNALSASGQSLKAQDTKQKTDDVISNKNDQYDYKPLAESVGQSQTSLGDIRWVNRVQLSKQTNYTISLLNELVLPTGRRRDINRLVDVPTGDGQFDLGVGVVGEYNMGSRFTFWSRLNYTWQAPDEVAARVPETASSSLSNSLDGQISRDLGDSFYTSIGSSFRAYQDIKLVAQYAFQYKQRDRHSGEKYQSSRYDLLGQDTDQQLHSVQLGLNYSTIALFRAKRFPVPLDFNLTSGIPLRGKNVIKDASVVAEASVFF